jgi:hypothetical protein
MILKSLAAGACAFPTPMPIAMAMAAHAGSFMPHLV